jgi:hypothetical protein
MPTGQAPQGGRRGVWLLLSRPINKDEIHMSDLNPYAAPKAVVRDIEPDGLPADIAGLPVSDAWRAKFFIFEKAGGVKLPRFKELAFGERMKIGFNILAFLFGPLYYIAKGMWKKGLVMFGICLAAVLLLSILLELAGLGRFADALGFGAGAVFAARANIDFYKKMVLNQNGWW